MERKHYCSTSKWCKRGNSCGLARTNKSFTPNTIVNVCFCVRIEEMTHGVQFCFCMRLKESMHHLTKQFWRLQRQQSNNFRLIQIQIGMWCLSIEFGVEILVLFGQLTTRKLVSFGWLRHIGETFFDRSLTIDHQIVRWILILPMSFFFKHRHKTPVLCHGSVISSITNLFNSFQHLLN